MSSLTIATLQSRLDKTIKDLIKLTPMLHKGAIKWLKMPTSTSPRDKNNPISQPFKKPWKHRCFQGFFIFWGMNYRPLKRGKIQLKLHVCYTNVTQDNGDRKGENHQSWFNSSFNFSISMCVYTCSPIPCPA